MRRLATNILLAAITLVVLVNLVFFYTYPINLGESDNPNYVSMIVTGTSNLIHAPGYAAIFYFISHTLFPVTEVSLAPHSTVSASWFDQLQTAQLMVHLFLFGVAIAVASRLFSKTLTTLFTIGWGCNILFMSCVDSAAPEWLQADLVAVTLLLFLLARTQTDLRMKAAVYSAASALFGIAYIVKFNSLLFGVTLLGILLLDEAGWRFKGIQAVAAALLFLAAPELYAYTYHFHSTGTTQLTYDHAWVMTESLPDDYFSDPEKLGQNSLRWAALAFITPADQASAEAIRSIDSGAPKADKDRVRPIFDRVFKLSRAELVQYVKTHPLPATYNKHAAAPPLYYYYGVQAIDPLGVDVFNEALLSRPEYFLKLVVVTFKDMLLRQPSFQLVPTDAYPLGFSFQPPDFTFRSAGVSHIVPPDSNPYFLPYYNPTETVSYYGVKFVGILTAMTALPVTYVLLNFAAMAGLFRLKSVFERQTAMCLLAGMVVFIAGSAVLLGMRTKEVIAATPFYFLLWSIGITGAFQGLRDLTNRSREPQPAPSKAETGKTKGKRK